MDKIIQANNLVKRYGQITAIDDISFYVERGKLFAFLGTNGAGKSTTIDILCTLTNSDSGQVVIDGNVLGVDDDNIRKIIGIVFQDGVLDNNLTVLENLKIRAKFYSAQAAAQRAMQAAKMAECEHLINRKYGALSGGERRRVDIARALVNTPKILFLDEPTTGLDPKTRKSIWQTITNLVKNQNVTVFLTTHYMQEASNADYVVVIGKGKVLAKGTPDALRQNYSFDTLSLTTTSCEKLQDYLAKNNIAYSTNNQTYLISLPNTKAAISILKDLENIIISFEVTCGTMDDAFINISGGEFKNV